MTSTVAHDLSAPPVRRRRRRFGYLVAIAVNAAMLWVAHHLLDWAWPAFLTDAFAELLPIVTLSFAATIAVNAAYLWFDAGWFKSLGSAVTSGISVAVALRTLQVYPFDFSSYAHDWSWLVTLLLIVAIAGAAISVVVESIRLITWPLRDHDRP